MFFSFPEKWVIGLAKFVTLVCFYFVSFISLCIVFVMICLQCYYISEVFGNFIRDLKWGSCICEEFVNIFILVCVAFLSI